MRSGKKKNRRRELDPRIDVRHNWYTEFFMIWFILLCVTAGQLMIFDSYLQDHTLSIPWEFILANAGYWALMATVFCLVTAGIRNRDYVRPMQRIGEAARKVAQGDFSVYLPPMRRDGKKDYKEVIFEDFNTMVEELGSTETLKTDFIANVSHEIKTPLSVIQNYATALQKEGLPDTLRQDYTETIIGASKKLTALVTNILKLNKLENQEINPEIAPYDLCRQLVTCALSFEEVWERKKITFEADIEERKIINADESMMELVWNNLLSNAIKYTAPGGAVTLRQTSDANTVTVSVHDTGYGMDRETVEHIFDRFYQGDVSHSGDGNGLGLSLVHKVIERVHGSIEVESELGKGSAFTVTLATGD